MGHQDKVVKLGRTASHRDAMLANMAMSLILHRMIRTTDAKAKALQPVVDRIISKAKQNTLTSKRDVAKTIHVREAFKKLYGDILPQFADRTSGFTRIIKLGVRRGDGASISVIELLTEKPKEEAVDAKGKKGEKAAAKKKPAASTAGMSRALRRRSRG
ncbi:MAG: 50S ribosomal protein L17 [candidate division Zixibacteria bacterium]|nr:50S ribosomal protein L17 [candidate division Zixibacteria bacterium]